MNNAVIVAGARTPFGRLLGSLGGLSAADLGSAAIGGALARARVKPAFVDYTIMGQVLQAGCGQNPARSAAIGAGVPLEVPATTVNKVCLSGLNAIASAAQLIALGEAEVIVAGGMESMSSAPHLLKNSRTGIRFGHATLIDHMAYDGLFDQLTQQDMGSLTQSWYNDHPPLSREEQDAFAARSHQRAAAASSTGVFDNEIIPVDVPQPRDGIVTVQADEGVRPDTTVEALSKLRPAYSPTGTITAGSASQISDGAAAVIVMNRESAEARGIPWLAQIGAHGMVAGPDSRLQLQPANATAKALRKQGLTAADLDIVEFNEAFAAIGIESARALGIDDSRVNVNGGAIAIGHPLGASGARLALHLALELQRRGGGTGAAALCGGGGQGEALILSVPPKD